MKGLEVLLKHRVSFHEGQYLLEDVVHLVLNLIKNPLVVLPGGQNARVLQINEVSRRFGLREIEDVFQVADAHLSVGEDEVEDAEAGGVGAGEKYLRPGFNIEML